MNWGHYMFIQCWRINAFIYIYFLFIFIFYLLCLSALSRTRGKRFDNDKKNINMNFYAMTVCATEFSVRMDNIFWARRRGDCWIWFSLILIIVLDFLICTFWVLEWRSFEWTKGFATQIVDSRECDCVMRFQSATRIRSVEEL